MDVEDQGNCQKKIKNGHTHTQKNKNRIEYRGLEKLKTIIWEHEWKNKSTRNYSPIANQNESQRRITDELGRCTLKDLCDGNKTVTPASIKI